MLASKQMWMAFFSFQKGLLIEADKLISNELLVREKVNIMLFDIARIQLFYIKEYSTS